MAFKMKGNPMKRNFGLPGINNNSEGNTDKPDGRSASSALQQMDETTPGPPQMKVPTGAKDVSTPLKKKKKVSPNKHMIKSGGEMTAHHEWMEVDGKQHKHPQAKRKTKKGETFYQPKASETIEREPRYKAQSKKQAEETEKRRKKSKSQAKKPKNIKRNTLDATAGVAQDRDYGKFEDQSPEYKAAYKGKVRKSGKKVKK
jgi:hypothetical protein